MTNKIGFLFDLDGVLIDSEREYSRIWNEINEVFPTGRDNLANEIKGQTLTKILTENFPDGDVREKVKIMLHAKEKDMRYEYCRGAEEFLSQLTGRQLPTAVVTSSDEVKMGHLYADIPEFRSKIDVVVDASMVRNSKPNPEGYLLGSESLGRPVRNCAVFEDSVQGVKAGRASGAYVVGIVGTKKREELAPHCDVVVDSLLEIDIESLCQILMDR